jgi:CRP-like cAMP-binding protein
MAKIPQESVRNILLRSLEPHDYELLEPHLERIKLDVGNVIANANEEIDKVCFPEGGVVSFSDLLAGGAPIGIGIIGLEGVTGWPVLLGCATSPHEATVAVGGGTALCIPNAALLETCGRSPSLNSLLLRFVQSFTIQLGRTIVSNLIDPIERRLSRWLLMNQDRLGTEDIGLTHQQIGVMLGVRRASVTDTLHMLEGEHVIRSRRGCITVRDRPALRRIAGESYGFAEAEYSRLIAPFGGDG